MEDLKPRKPVKGAVENALKIIEENATSEDEEKVVPVNLVYRTKKGEKKQKPHQVKLNIPMKFAVGAGIHEGDYEAILTLRKEKDEDGNRKLDITFKKK